VRIGGIELENQLVLAPMSGVTDLPFRRLAREAGCALAFTEMVCARALVLKNPHSAEILAIDAADHPVGAQLFGADPAVMAAAVPLAEAAGADIIDVNMGCPVRKVVAAGEGAALMRRPDLAGALVAAVVRAATRPVTVKIRAGWAAGEVNAVEVAQRAVAAGAAAVTVHGRTRDQFYGGCADWSVIAAVRRALPPSIPVIGNGDAFAPDDAARLLAETGCQAVMVGRGALGDPWIFARIRHYLETGETLPPPPVEVRIGGALRHLDMLVEHVGERRAVRQMRTHASWYIRGLPGAAAARQLINRCTGRDEMREVLLGLLERARRRVR
jgi:tRNA-dihydrouridine synthase B